MVTDTAKQMPGILFDIRGTHTASFQVTDSSVSKYNVNTFLVCYCEILTGVTGTNMYDPNMYLK